jgi:hypothetical protein
MYDVQVIYKSQEKKKKANETGEFIERVKG